jgi:CheY-like chemotaxis protein
LRAILESAGYLDVHEAVDGQGAIDFLDSDKNEANSVDLVLMDLVMPGMDGIQACRIIKSHDRHRDIPVIVVTSQAEAGKLQLGAHGAIHDHGTRRGEREKIEHGRIVPLTCPEGTETSPYQCIEGLSVRGMPVPP